MKTPDGPEVARRSNADGAKVPGTRHKKIPPEQKRSTSGVIYAAFGEKIKKCLKNPEVFPKEFRHYVKKKNFRVFEIPYLGLKDVLVIPRSESDKKVCYT